VTELRNAMLLANEKRTCVLHRRMHEYWQLTHRGKQKGANFDFHSNVGQMSIDVMVVFKDKRFYSLTSNLLLQYCVNFTAHM